MKNIFNILAVIAILTVFGSCQRELLSPSEDNESRTIICASIDSESKTVFGEKSGNSYPNYWQKGDAICVNGLTSEPLGDDAEGKSSASFTFNGVIQLPYFAACPASSVLNYDNGNATIAVPSSQRYVYGSYDPDAAVMYAKSENNPNLSLSTFVSIFHLSLNGDAEISRIQITGEDDAVLCGEFSTDFETFEPSGALNTVTMTATTPVQLPADFYICVAPGMSGVINLEISDSEGGSMRKSANIKTALESGKMYSAPVLEYSPTAFLKASLKNSTSCSAVLSWTHNNDASEDVEKPYKIALYKDSGCTDLVVSHEIEASDACWDSRIPCFAFGGLEPGTTYYFRATDITEDASLTSNTVSFTTDEFTIVDASTVSDAKVGDIILGENFSEVSFGPDEFELAAGFCPKVRTNVVYSGENPEGSFVNYKSTDTYVSWANITEGTRLSHDWGYVKNNSSYFRAGYLRNATSSSGNRMHIVTPKFAGIPDGKYATVEVTVKASRYSNDNDVAVFVESGDLSNRKLSADLTDAYPMNILTSKTWETRTITISNVSSSNRLAIGSYENIDTKNRFFLSDISVKLTDLYDTPKAQLKAKSTASSSSTLVFSWSETEETDASVDVANAYTATLYKDPACTEADQSFDIPAGSGAWKSSTPKFVLGGLEPSTTYWFKVFDTTNNIESDLIKATTDDFTVVKMPETITGAGVVLAEDFGEIRWEYDAPSGAAGFRCSDCSSFSNTTVKTSETNTSSKIYQGYHASGGGGEATFKGQNTALSNSVRLNGWVSDSNVYIHPGYLKLGTSSTKGWILTPEFTVPEGKKAIVTVTVTACWAASSQNSNWAVAVLTPTLANATPSSHTASFSWPDTEDFTCYQTIAFTKQNVWAKNSVTGLEVHHSDRITFGAINGCANNKGRVNISDMTVEVLAVVDEGTEVTSFNMENPSVTAYFDKAESTYTDENWSTVSYLSDYCENSSANRKDIPSPAIITWGYDTSYSVTVYNDSDRTDIEMTSSGTGSHADIYNLCPGKTYYYTVKDGSSTTIKLGSFDTYGRVRMMKVSDSYNKARANNCRDLGGWATTDGHTLKYGKIFRGSRMDSTTDTEKEYITGYMGIKGDVELRCSDAYEAFSDSKWGVTYLHTPYTNWNTSGLTTNLTDPDNINKTFNDIIGYVTDGKPLYIHCSAGADRTGYICMLVEAVLGVSQRDCSIDYELTSFSASYDSGEHTRDRCGKIYDQFFVKGMNYISGYTGSTFKAKATNILLDAGITQTQIDEFRTAMLE